MLYPQFQVNRAYKYIIADCNSTDFFNLLKFRNYLTDLKYKTYDSFMDMHFEFSAKESEISNIYYKDKNNKPILAKNNELKKLQEVTYNYRDKIWDKARCIEELKKSIIAYAKTLNKYIKVDDLDTIDYYLDYNWLTKLNKNYLSEENISETLTEIEDDSRPVDIYIYQMLSDKINKAFNEICELSDTDPKYYAFSQLHSRKWKSNRNKLYQHLLVFTYRIQSRQSIKIRLDGIKFGADFSYNQLVKIHGSITYKNNVIGQELIKEILLNYNVIQITDSKYVHPSKRFNQDDFSYSQNILYSIYGMGELSERPMIRYNNGVAESNNENYTVDDLKLVKYTIDDLQLLTNLKGEKRKLDINSTKDMQVICLSQLTLKDKFKENYDNQIAAFDKGVGFKNNYQFESTDKFLRTLLTDNIRNIKVTQSKLTGRIFNGLTNTKRELRNNLVLKCDKDTKLVQIDGKCTQLILSSLLYAEKVIQDSLDKNLTINKEIESKAYAPFNWMIENDVYSYFANIFESTRNQTKLDLIKAVTENIYASKRHLFTIKMTEMFSDFIEFLSELKGYGHKAKTAQLLQSLEAEIYVGQIDEKILNGKSALSILYRNHIWATSIHDCIVMAECDSNYGVQALKLAYRSRFKLLNLTDDMFEKMLKIEEL